MSSSNIKTIVGELNSIAEKDLPLRGSLVNEFCLRFRYPNSAAVNQLVNSISHHTNNGPIRMRYLLKKFRTFVKDEGYGDHHLQEPQSDGVRAREIRADARFIIVWLCYHLNIDCFGEDIKYNYESRMEEMETLTDAIQAKKEQLRKLKKRIQDNQQKIQDTEQKLAEERKQSIEFQNYWNHHLIAKDWQLFHNFNKINFDYSQMHYANQYIGFLIETIRQKDELLEEKNALIHKKDTTINKKDTIINKTKHQLKRKMDELADFKNKKSKTK